MRHNILNMRAITTQSKEAACIFDGCDYVVMDDCATGVVELVIDVERDGECWHGFCLELKFNASFNSNVKNSGAILISGLNVLRAKGWYTNNGFTDDIDYEIGSADENMIKLTLQQHVVDRIKAKGIKTILRDEVLDIVFSDELKPEQRGYGDGLHYVDVKYTSDFEIDIVEGAADGSIPFIIEGMRGVTADFKVSFDEDRQKAYYLGGKLVTPKVHKIKNDCITSLTYRDWRDADDRAIEAFNLTATEIMLIKQRIFDEVKQHYDADAYPQGKEHYLAN